MHVSDSEQARVPSSEERSNASQAPQPSSGGDLSIGEITALQASAGNAAVARALRTPRATAPPTLRQLARQVTATKRHTRMLGAPPVVGQLHSWTCWAAALESWQTVVPDRPMLTQQELIDRFKTRGDGALDPEAGWPPLARALQIQYTLVEQGSDLAYLWRTIYSKLTNDGYVLLMFKVGEDAAHTVVVYGIEETATGEFTVYFMDPGGGGALKSLSVKDFQATGHLIVGWPGVQFYQPKLPL